MADEHLRGYRRLFARDGAFYAADSDNFAGVLCPENHMGVHDFCGVSGFCGTDGRVPSLMADNEHSYTDCILHHTQKDILAEVNLSDSCANIFCEIHFKKGDIFT